LQAHVIYTVPLRLVRSIYGPQLKAHYGRVFVLPMVKVVTRGSREKYVNGWKCIEALLSKRIGQEHQLIEIIANDASEFLIRYSGGHIRNLMTLMQDACSYTEALPISLAVAHKAIGQFVSIYSTGIEESHWGKLVALEHSPDQQIINGDADYLAMLENLSVMEYINGGNDDQFASNEPWYAVNPIVRELKKFKKLDDKWKPER